MSHDTKINWPAVRVDYEAKTLTVEQVAKQHDISVSALQLHALREGWERRYATTASRPILIGRMFALLERQMAQLEDKMDEPIDKEVAVLGNLTRNLEKLIELDTKERTGTKNSTGSAVDIEALRKKLSRRIEQLKQGD